MPYICGGGALIALVGGIGESLGFIVVIQHFYAVWAAPVLGDISGVTMRLDLHHVSPRARPVPGRMSQCQCRCSWIHQSEHAWKNSAAVAVAVQMRHSADMLPSNPCTSLDPSGTIGMRFLSDFQINFRSVSPADSRALLPPPSLQAPLVAALRCLDHASYDQRRSLHSSATRTHSALPFHSISNGNDPSVRIVRYVDSGLAFVRFLGSYVSVSTRTTKSAIGNT